MDSAKGTVQIMAKPKPSPNSIDSEIEPKLRKKEYPKLKIPMSAVLR